MLYKYAVIVPALNESGNLKILVPNIFKNLSDSKVIIVDDSGDIENKKLHTVMLEHGNRVEIINRGQKLGRGSAIIDGLKSGMKDKNIRYFFEMDADLSHDPAELSRFLKLKDKYDMIVGSRYMQGSKITKWPWWRLAQSRVINKILNLWLGLSLTDYTDGYRLYGRSAVEFLTSTKLKEKGFISLSEVAFKLKKAGFKICEVPVSFTDRTLGKSNANTKELLNSLIGAIRIRFS